MARTKKYSRKSQKRSNRGSKRRGQTGGYLAPLGSSEFSGGNTSGAATFMEAKVGAGPAQTTGQDGSIAIKGGQTGGRTRRKGPKKLRGGSLMDALSSAIVPLALFGMNHKIGRRLRKKR
jgi:hypothetical protein